MKKNLKAGNVIDFVTGDDWFAFYVNKKRVEARYATEYPDNAETFAEYCPIQEINIHNIDIDEIEDEDFFNNVESSEEFENFEALEKYL